MKRMTLATLMLVLGLLLVACGPAQEAAEPVATPEPIVSESAVDEMASEEMEDEEVLADETAVEPTIVEIAVNDGRFTTLVTAVTEAGLVETLSGDGPFTVFAPTDDAFAALPEGTIEALLADAQGALTDVLLYHVVSGDVRAETVVGLDSAVTVGGEAIAIEVRDFGVVLNESVQVVITDIVASNGVIHVVDAVLLPPSMRVDATPSIAEIAAADGNFTTLLAALEAAGLAETFAGEGEYTVFAPTDAAFAALPEGTIDALLADPQGALTDILLYHVVDGAVPAETVVGLPAATTLLGEEVAIRVTETGVVLNDAVNVVATDIMASNGIIHVIDAVLLPPEPVTIIDAAIADGRFTTLVAAVEAAGLVDALNAEGPFTVFAPTDAAFAALPAGTLEALVAEPTGQLTNILLYHVVEGAVPASQVVGLDSAVTLLGQPVTIKVSDGGQVFLNDKVQVIITDIETDNGIIHVIDAVLIPAT